MEQALAPLGKAAETANDAAAGIGGASISGNFASAAQKLQDGLGKG
ncbi:hypothetical protein [Arthrobacter sp. ISL-69]|nr:hypothetical protein [Arthrobacter sp. ISL-69]